MEKKENSIKESDSGETINGASVENPRIGDGESSSREKRIEINGSDSNDEAISELRNRIENIPDIEAETSDELAGKDQHKAGSYSVENAKAHHETVIRTDRGIKLYEKVFGEDISKFDGQILDLGAGDSNFAESVNGDESDELKVIRCDYGYRTDPPKYKDGATSALAQELPFSDESFGRVISSCMLEHIPKEDSSRVLTEMLRVTKEGGTIMIFPAYQSLRGKYPFAQREILAKNFFDRLTFILRRQSTLVIKKDSSLTEEEWQNAVDDLAHSVRLPDWLDKIERIYMKIRFRLRGNVKMHR